MTWKDLLARRADLIGGIIQLRTKDGVYRARIDAIDALEPTVHFKTSLTLKEIVKNGGSEWIPCENKMFRFPTNLTLLGNLPPGRIQFDDKPDWVVIYPNSDTLVRG